MQTQSTSAPQLTQGGLLKQHCVHFLHQLAKNTEQLGYLTSATQRAGTSAAVIREPVTWLRESAFLTTILAGCLYLLGMKDLGELLIPNTLKLGFGL